MYLFIIFKLKMVYLLEIYICFIDISNLIYKTAYDRNIYKNNLISVLSNEKELKLWKNQCSQFLLVQAKIYNLNYWHPFFSVTKYLVSYFNQCIMFVWFFYSTTTITSTWIMKYRLCVITIRSNTHIF